MAKPIVDGQGVRLEICSLLDFQFTSFLGAYQFLCGLFIRNFVPTLNEPLLMENHVLNLVENISNVPKIISIGNRYLRFPNLLMLGKNMLTHLIRTLSWHDSQSRQNIKSEQL